MCVCVSVFMNLEAYGCSQGTPVVSVFLCTHVCASVPEYLYLGDCVILYMCVSTWHHNGAPAELTWFAVACVCMRVRALGIMILPELPCCLPLCSDPVPWCTAAIQGSVLVGGQLGIIGTK